MPANEFEKQVQRSMDDLKIHPSGEVWQKVEGRIREKRKKRRVVFILFLFAGLLLLGYGIVNFSSDGSNNPDSTVTFKNKNESKDHSNKKVETFEKKTDETLMEKTGITDDIKITDKQLPVDPDLQKNKTGNINTTRRKEGIKEVKEKLSFKSRKTPAVVDPPETINKDRQIQKDIVQETNKLITNNNNAVTVNTEPPVTEEKNELLKTDKHDTSSIGAVESNVEMVTKNETALVKENQKKPEVISRKIRWSVNIATGISAFSNDLFSFKKSDALMADYGGSMGTGGPGPVAPAPPFYPSESKPGLALKLGVNLEKNISQRSSISAGLQYSYLSDRLKPGTKTDSTLPLNTSFSADANSYYRGPSVYEYTDRFHFIELPVIYHWKINKHPKRFLSLDLGISTRYLISTNALVYDTALRGVYYHDDKVVNKLHFGLNSGLSFHFVNKKGNEWSIGPQFSVDGRQIFKSRFETRKYFIDGGVNLKFFFPIKKNQVQRSY